MQTWRVFAEPVTNFMHTYVSVILPGGVAIITTPAFLPLIELVATTENV